MNYPLARAFIISVMMAGGLSSRGADTAPAATSSSVDILKQSVAKYASLSSYSDQGTTLSNLNNTKLSSTFSIKLARPNLYLIEWQSTTESPTSITTGKGHNAVWCAGDGDFLDMGTGAKKVKDQVTAIASATGISSGAAGSIPGTFFVLDWGNQLGGNLSHAQQEPDAKIGDIDCYVFTFTLSERKRTLWIGKQDLLIHQIRNVTSAAALKAIMEANAKRLPDGKVPKMDFTQDLVSTETHTHITVNQSFSAQDFAPH